MKVQLTLAEQKELEEALMRIRAGEYTDGRKLVADLKRRAARWTAGER